MSEWKTESGKWKVDREVDATGRLVFPTFCDSHTHLVYANSREHEFVDKIRGLSYEEIAKRGGGILNSAKRMGYRVPQDISICGFTNGERAIACDPMLTTVEQRGVAVGKEAVQILVGQVEGTIPRDKVERRIVKTRLVVRGTTR